MDNLFHKALFQANIYDTDLRQLYKHCLLDQ